MLGIKSAPSWQRGTTLRFEYLPGTWESSLFPKNLFQALWIKWNELLDNKFFNWNKSYNYIYIDVQNNILISDVINIIYKYFMEEVKKLF